MPKKAAPEVQTPIYTMRNPESGSTVTLIGTIHVAEREYYETISDMAAALHAQGAVVYYEAVLPPSPEQLAAADPEDRELMEMRYATLADDRADLLALGLVAERDMILLQPGWEVHDVNMLESVVMSGPEQVHYEAKISRRRRRFMRLMPGWLRREILLQQTLILTNLVRQGRDRTRIVRGRALDDLVQREAREMAAVDRLLAEKPGGDLVKIGGLLHMSAFCEAFAERGYKDDGVEWITAFDPAKLDR